MKSSDLITELFRIAKSRNITQKMIAEKTGRKESHISRMKKQPPTLDKFIEVCDAVGIEIELNNNPNKQ